MIVGISGKIVQKNVNSLVIESHGILYEVFVPAAVMARIQSSAPDGSELSLTTYHFHQVEPSRSTPLLFGFLNEIEKEFFQVFITVSGIGPRAALRALNQPISLIARAIDAGDVNFLKTLPGIGQQRAREIVAKLQNKIGKFCLMQEDGIIPAGGRTAGAVHSAGDIEEEAAEILTRLEYKKAEAAAMIRKALERLPHPVTTEELLNEVYKQTKPAKM